jgi:hypothetical protein
MATTPRFKKYHTGPWPYPFSAGVGLMFTGRPTDALAFIDARQGSGCSPVATRRILTELEDGRTKFTTVRSHLDFDWIGDALAAVGVTMTIVPPTATPQNQEYDLAALMLIVGRDADLEQFTIAERELVEERRRHTEASLARIPFALDAFV